MMPADRIARVNRLWGAVVVGIALILSGCASPAASTAPAVATPTGSSSPEGSALDELRAAYVAAGGQCDRITRRHTAVAAEAGDCDGGALITVYRSQTQRDSAVRALEGLQDTNPSPHVIAVGPDWIVNGADAEAVAEAMGGAPKQIGVPAPPPAPELDLTTDSGICAADAELTNLELNDALAPLLGFPADRDARTPDQDEAIREYKNTAFLRGCPARAG
jgi:hypothetical protein